MEIEKEVLFSCISSYISTVILDARAEIYIGIKRVFGELLDSLFYEYKIELTNDLDSIVMILFKIDKDDRFTHIRFESVG